MADVDGAWLRAVLGLDHVPLVRTATAWDDGRGLVGRTLLVELEPASTSLPERLVVKVAQEDEARRELAASLRLFEREARFYGELAPTAGLPLAWGIAGVGPDGEEALVIEHLAGEVPHLREPLPRTHLHGALEAIAALHAAHADQALPAWLPGADAPQLAMLAPGLNALAPTIEARWGQALGGISAGELGDRVAAALEVAWAGPHTVVHGDLRPGNLIVRPSGEVVVIDWQTVGRGPAAFDVAYLVGASRPPDPEAALDRYPGAIQEDLYEAAVVALGQAVLTWGVLTTSGGDVEAAGLDAWVAGAAALAARLSP